MIKEAAWICCPTEIGSVCPEFCRKIRRKKEVKSAILQITADGVYEARYNDQKIGNAVLAPGCTVYEKRLQYQTYDLTRMLASDGILSVGVGPGWFRGRISKKCTEQQEMPAAVIAELVIEYADGEKEVIRTDEAWTVRTSGVLSSDLYDGETYDAAAEKKELGQACICTKIPKEILTAQEGEAVCEHERIHPVRMFVTPKGERVIDFGQNLAGYVEITLNAKANDRIVLSHAEIMDKEGNFYTENYRSAKAKACYICKEGLQTLKPRFVFYGYRYIRVDEFPGEIDPSCLTSVAVYSDMKRTGWIRTGNAKINRLVENVLWSQRSNFVDIPTDCPQRDERMGWLGDAQVFCRTAGLNYRADRFFEKWMADMRCDQRADGSVPDVVPNFWRMDRSSAAWGDAVTVIPWTIYELYGDRKILEDNFEAMKKWVDYITADTLDAGLWTCPEKEKRLWGKHYGDWLALDAPYGSYKGSTNDDRIASAFYLYSAELVVKAGKVLGKDVSAYEKLCTEIRKAYREHFSECVTQTDHVLALQFGLTEEPQKTADHLAEMIRENRNRLQTGFVGTPYLLQVLCRYGYAGLAYTLFLQEEHPSWLYEVNHGATTIWEHWDGIRDDGTSWSSDMNSYNHYAYGSVLEWVYSVAAGIRPAENAPGFERIVVEPVSDKRLGWLEASVETAHGRITSRWVYEGGHCRYEVDTPVPAEIIIGGISHKTGAGTHVFYN